MIISASVKAKEGGDLYRYISEPILHRSEVDKLGETIVGYLLSDRNRDDVDLSDSNDVK